MDFRGLHTACICGANGAGKSSLLEAIAWAVWGESRAASDDDVIHVGMSEALVDFIFISQGTTYRILRSRTRKQATTLEFQIAIAAQDLAAGWPKFRSLTAKGVRATQQLILEHLKLDYDTFINSAYLRQGRADEFMLKRPSDRKQILTDLLKLDQYEDLAERAKDYSRQLKGQIDQLTLTLGTIHRQLEQASEIADEQTTLEQQLAHQHHQQAADTQALQALQANQHQRQTWQQQLIWHQQQQQTLEQDCQRLQQELNRVQQQRQDLDRLLQQERTIVSAYTNLQALQRRDEELATKFQTYQAVQTQQHQCQQQQAEAKEHVQAQRQRLQAQLELLGQQHQEIQTILAKAPEVEQGLKHLQQARQQLELLDQLQTQAAPLLQRQQQIQAHLDRTQTRLQARLEDLRVTVQHQQQQQQRRPHLQQAVVQINQQIVELEQQRSYQQMVLEKGQERRNFMERLQESQRVYEAKLAEVEQKIHWLKQEGQRHSLTSAVSLEQGSESRSLRVRDGDGAAVYSLNLLNTIAYPPCPLCDQPLDQQHWHLVLEKHQREQQEILDQIWVIREQLTTSEREIQVLRQEYRDLDQELNHYASTLERRGQLQEQLQATEAIEAILQSNLAEIAAIERQLQTNEFEPELQAELYLLEESLTTLNYDERDHALARGQTDRWRWADIKAAELRTAQRRQAQLAEQEPILMRQIEGLDQQLQQVADDAQQQHLVFDRQLADLAYNPDYHAAIRTTLRQSQSWQLRYQDLQRAKHTYPGLSQQLEDLLQALQTRQHTGHMGQHQIESLTQRLQTSPDYQEQIHTIDQRIQARRSQLDQSLAHLGRLQQQQQQLEGLRQQAVRLTRQLQTAQRQYRVYQELGQAFGKNGIQALMIENVLPQLEAETNRILSRLSANQLHVQFVTQRSRRDQSRTAKANPKLIETLDILIADAQGTRPYETYSGGEAFRVNFAIRLALARLLAQRSGAALQLLIIDEGFGTQDAEGCNRLIAAINAIAPDFACILTVTHMPHLREAFQTRIEVCKTEQGSGLQLIA